MSHRQLQMKVDEMNEEMSLRSVGPTSTSLLSEIEQSMEAEELEQEREQVLRNIQKDLIDNLLSFKPNFYSVTWV